jgi:tripartite-type tricarboxylate transporter receptor subunit TctC
MRARLCATEVPGDSMLKYTMRSLSFIAFAALLATSFAQAQDWPQRPVKLLVPFAAGGNIDIMGRLAAQRLSDALGQQFVVENRVGGNGTIATESVARAPADGYTLLWASTSVICIFPVISKVNYDPATDLVPISLFSTSPQALIVNPKIPAQTVSEFIAYVRSQKSQLAYAGGGGPGSVSNLLMATFLKRAGLAMTNVSYRGTAPAMTDLIAGHIPTMFVPISEALPQAKAGLIRMLAVSSATRNPQAPDVPTIAEQGFPGYDFVSWTGMMAPAATPKEVVDRIGTQFVRALNEPQFVDQLHRHGVEPAPEPGPAPFASFIAKEIARWGEAVKIAGVTLQ